MSMRIRPAIAAAIVTAALAQGSLADVLVSGDILRVRFTINNNFNLTPDVLKLNFGLITVQQAYGMRIAELYDGNTLLGTAQSSSFGGHVGLLNLDPSNSWKTAGSVWNFDSPGVADFGPILNGTIDGRIDFTIASGAVDIPLNQVNLSMIQATSANGGFVVTPVPTITSVEIVSPVVLGDMNCDGVVDLTDVAPFILALTDPPAYQAQFPACNLMLADTNQDGQIDGQDVDSFIGILTGP